MDELTLVPYKMWGRVYVKKKEVEKIKYLLHRVLLFPMPFKQTNISH